MGWTDEDEYQEKQVLKRITEAVACEREACAQAAESSAQDHAGCGHEPLYWDGRQDAATCIRARSE